MLKQVEDQLFPRSPNEKASFWVHFAEPKDFTRIHPVTGDNTDDLYIISHNKINFYFNRAD
jgi:hypothetical protein